MITKQTAEYRGQTWTRYCRDCVNFRVPKSCGFVSGDIDPRGTCLHFKLRLKGQQDVKDQ